MPRLDQELVSRGLARSRTQAGKLIAEGAVLIDGKIAVKAAQHISNPLHLEVRASESNRYVSRAAYKLLGALKAFPEVAVLGRRCLDAGASTGGFTQVLLEAGAARVCAVDVGHQQMVPELRENPRVQLFEGLNVRELSAARLGGQVELTVADLSFISLSLVIAPLAAATAAGGQLLLMIKPQFEVGRERLAKTGVVSSQAERRRAVCGVAEAALAAELSLRGLVNSSLPGQDGNIEYFLWLSRPLRPERSKLGVQEFLESHWPVETSPGEGIE